MRRFINSFFGRTVGQVMILSLVMPFVTLGLVNRAEAQIQGAPTWAVIEFVDKSPEGRAGIGALAAEAVQSELAKLQRYDMLPQETVSRTISSLGLQNPPTDQVSLLRLAGELRATTLVTGEVVNWRVESVGGGKRADVILRVVVMDVASGLPVNGAALSASSSVRTGDIEDATVVQEALVTGAAKAVSIINSQTLPVATVLNTRENTALINQGSRTGFRDGMEVIVIRGRDQVATAKVSDLEPDSAIVTITRPIRGIQPGDRVRAVFAVPVASPKFGAEGGIEVMRPRERGRPPGSGFGTLLIVLGLAALLLTGGNSTGFSPAESVSAEALMYPDSSGRSAVKISWKRDIFARGNSQTMQWQVFRDDVLGTPVQVADGIAGSTIDDDAVTRDISWGNFEGVIGGNTCNVTEMPLEDATVAGVIAGRAYSYAVALVYKLSSIDLPDGGGTGGGTGGGSGGGGTASDCYFVSKQVAAKGVATPLPRPSLVNPGSNAVIAGDTIFTFGSVVNASFPMNIEYALQVSSDPNFPKAKSKVYARVTRGDLGTLSSGTVTNLLSRLASDFGVGVTEFYWRIGARNVADKPGPVPDQSGERYVFSPSRRFTIPAPPPPPPSL
ncbi:MAG: hypothetical protein KJZ62_09280 [Fimbriimonadaceae bacterium]|nr:hypothetical protein [Fimbriimonadaceae bacterium]QOJ11788.1 MAG: hypothetical protein HRU74_06895 [Chthonomonadaceae bacterium]